MASWGDFNPVKYIEKGGEKLGAATLAAGRVAGIGLGITETDAQREAREKLEELQRQAGARSADFFKQLQAQQPRTPPQVGVTGLEDTQAGKVGTYTKPRTVAGTGEIIPGQQIVSERGYAGAQIARGPEAELRAKQLGLIGSLEAAAAGQGPSIAQQQLQRATDENIRQQMAIAASARGGNIGAAQRQAQIGAAGAQQQAAGQAAILRAQEQIAARGELADVLSRTRAQDVDIAKSQAQLLQQAGIFTAEEANRFQIQRAQLKLQADQGNQRAALQLMQMDDWLKMQFANLGYRGMEIEAGLAGGAEERAEERARGYQRIGGATVETVGKMATLMSDRHAKSNIAGEPHEIDEFTRKLKGYSYDYKDPDAPGAAPGRRYGVMAQDLEKSKMGKSLVVDTPQGKMIRTDQAVGTLMAALARLNERLERVEA